MKPKILIPALVLSATVLCSCGSQPSQESAKQSASNTGQSQQNAVDIDSILSAYIATDSVFRWEGPANFSPSYRDEEDAVYVDLKSGDSFSDISSNVQTDTEYYNKISRAVSGSRNDASTLYGKIKESKPVIISMISSDEEPIFSVKATSSIHTAELEFYAFSDVKDPNIKSQQSSASSENSSGTGGNGSGGMSLSEIYQKGKENQEADTSTNDATYSPTLGEQNALRSARDYIDMTGFSYTGLIEQLEYEGYSHEESVYGADNCGADWNAEAAESAKDYMDMTAFSRQGLIDQLLYEGFTKEQAEYGAASVGY